MELLNDTYILHWPRCLWSICYCFQSDLTDRKPPLCPACTMWVHKVGIRWDVVQRLKLRWARRANHGQLWMQHLVRLQAKQKILSNHRLFHFIGSVVYRNCQNVSARSKPLKNCRSRIVRGLFTDCLFLKCLCVYQLLWPVALPEVLSKGTFSGETGLHLCYQALTCWQSKGIQFESVLSQQSLL